MESRRPKRRVNRGAGRLRRIVTFWLCALFAAGSLPITNGGDVQDYGRASAQGADRVLICELEESEPTVRETRTWVNTFKVHRHTGECYNGAGELICGIWENAYYHKHNAYCYDEAGTLVCGLSAKEPHIHTDACYSTHEELVCGRQEEEGHTHTDACYTVSRELTCGQQEEEGHQHTDACYVIHETYICGKEESAGHTHTDACYEDHRELTCTVPEDPGHTHTEACYTETETYTPDCGQTESDPVYDENGEMISPGHKHTEACYLIETVREPDCGETERPAHIHGEECYTTTRTLICGQEEREGHTHTDECKQMTRELICEKEEKTGHMHGPECYTEKRTLTCGKEAKEGHRHGEACYRTVQVLECDRPDSTHRHGSDCLGPNGKDIICGKLEVPRFESSEKNWHIELTVISEGHRHSDACYAPEQTITDTPEPTETESETPAPAETDTPEPTETESATPAPAETDTPEYFAGEMSSAGASVSIQAGEDAHIPAGASLQAEEITDQGIREGYENRIQEKLNDSEEATLVQLMDISILDAEGQKIQPDGTVWVTVRVEAEIPEGARVKVIHFPDEPGANGGALRAAPAGPKRMLRSRSSMLRTASAPTEGEEVSSSFGGNTVSFAASGFSVYAIVYITDGTEHTIKVDDREKPPVGTFTVKVAWLGAEDPEKGEAPGETVPPEGTEVTLSLYLETEEGDTVTADWIKNITLDGIKDAEGETAPWTAKFSELAEPGENEKYAARQTADANGFRPYLEDGTLMGEDIYLYTDGGTIVNRADPIEYIHLKIKTVDSRELQLALKGAKYSLQETDEAYDPLPDAKETLYESDSQGLFTVSLQKPKSGTAYYRLTQTGYSFGYRADGAPAEICFSVSETGEISRLTGDGYAPVTDHLLTVRNESLLVPVRLVKTDGLTGKTLPGAEFRIYMGTDVKGAIFSLDGVSRFESGEDGVFYDGMLIGGQDYYLLEVQAPEGMGRRSYALHVEEDGVSLTNRIMRFEEKVETRDEKGVYEVQVPDWPANQAYYTVHYYLRGTNVKVAEDISGYAEVGSKLSPPAEEPEFLEAYQNAGLTRDEKRTDRDVTVKTAGTTIRVYYSIPLTVTVANREVIYDGKTQHGFTMEEEGGAVIDGLLESDRETVKIAYREARGRSVKDSGATGTFISAESSIPAYYERYFTPGTLTILPKEITVKITGRTTVRTYNGNENTSIGYTSEVSDSAYMKYNIVFSGTKEARRKDVGITMMGLSAEQFSNRDANYHAVFEVTDGSIEIQPRNLKIITRGIKRRYDGKPLTFASISILGAASADKITGVTTGTITDVGTAVNTYELNWGEADPNNYSVTEQLGTLEITPRDLRIMTGSKMKYYDGKPLTCGTVRMIGRAEPDEIEVKTTGSITEVGKTDNTCEIIWKNAKETNYTVQIILGSLEVREAMKPSKTTSGATKRKPTQYTLRVTYSTYDGRNKPADRVIKLKPGEEYYVVSPVIPGYLPDQEIVAGEIKKNTTVRVQYSQAVYRLEISFVNMRNTRIAEPYTEEIAYGKSFSVPAPQVEGYTPTISRVMGKMGSGDTQISVLYLSESEQAEYGAVKEIQEYETPLGLDLHSYQMGICAE